MGDKAHERCCAQWKFTAEVWDTLLHVAGADQRDAVRLVEARPEDLDLALDAHRAQHRVPEGRTADRRLRIDLQT